MVHVVSFLAPRPAHPYFQDYTPFLEILGDSCRKFGHRHIIITDDPELARLPECPGGAEFGIGEGFPVTMPDNLMKAIICGQMAYLNSPLAKEDTVLVGPDCVLARDPAEVFKQDFDIAFTTGPFTDCILNTGAIYVRGGSPVRHIWARAFAAMGGEWGDEQRALADIVKPTIEPSVTVGDGFIIRFMPVDPYNLAPDYPAHDCTHGYVLHFRGPRKAWMKDYCAKWLGIGERVEWNVCPNTDDRRVSANVKHNSQRVLPWLRETPAHDRHAVIVGGGPSAGDMDILAEIRARVENDQDIFALNGAADWLAARGIAPRFHVMLDARPGNVAFVNGKVAEQYLVASQCHPVMFDVLSDQSVTLWHPVAVADADIGAEALKIGGGITVGLSAMALVYAMGYRKLHLYGYDSSDRDGEAHAYRQDEDGAETARREIWLDRRHFACSPAMYAQANAFPDFAAMLQEAGALITVHGDGLLPSIARKMVGLPI